MKPVPGTPDDPEYAPYAAVMWPENIAAAAVIRGKWERTDAFRRLKPREMKRLRELLKTAIDLHLEGRPLKSRRLLGDLKKF